MKIPAVISRSCSHRVLFHPVLIARQQQEKEETRNAGDGEGGNAADAEGA